MIRVEVDHPLVELASSAWRAALDLALPERCASCGAELGGDAGLCATCHRATPFLEPPFCRQCARPQPGSAVDDPLCADCARHPPAFARAVAAAAHQGAARAMVLRFKHGGRPALARPLAALMLEVGADMARAADAIAPVPLHWLRQARRGFNQAALLAEEIGEAVAREPVLELLRKPLATPSQQSLGAAARRANLDAGAFALDPRARIEGARILLIDDVLTTGATLDACAALLLRAGASKVEALTATRVVDPERDPI